MCGFKDRRSTGARERSRRERRNIAASSLRKGSRPLINSRLLVITTIASSLGRGGCRARTGLKWWSHLDGNSTLILARDTILKIDSLPRG